MAKRFKAGVLGLKRGQVFARQFQDNPDTELVAGCDHDERARKSFQEVFPGVEVYADYAEFLKADLEVVMIASYCPAHGPHAVQALEAGKHVLSEVTAFHTLAEGVELVRTVERTGLTYMMAENYCYFTYIEEMKRLFSEGRIGKFMYAECEYVHDIRWLMVTNPYGSPHWHCWLPPIYYCTHPLGPILMITGDRPVQVAGMNTGSKMQPEMANIDMEVGLVKMASGAVAKVLCGLALSREPSSVWYCIYGTKGEMENNRWPSQGVLNLYEEDNTDIDYQISYQPVHSRLVEEAGRAGHGGGDFFVVHDFVQVMKNGSPPPIDVYLASDMTLPGILAHRSAEQGGQFLEVPDFKNEEVRKRYEKDDWAPPQG